MQAHLIIIIILHVRSALWDGAKEKRTSKSYVNTFPIFLASDGPREDVNGANTH